MNTYNKRTVLALYRAKIRVCNDLGYSLGKWNDGNLTRREDFNIYKIKKNRKKRNMGAYIMDNLRFRYKLYRDEYDNDNINALIDDGFTSLRKLNKLHVLTKEDDFKEKIKNLIY